MSNSTFPSVNFDLTQLSTDQMIEVDRLMSEYYGITLVQMMERVGLNLVRLAHKFAQTEHSFFGTFRFTEWLPKRGLFILEIKTQVGQLFLADIGVPRQLYIKMRVNLEGNPFEESGIVRLYCKRI